MTHHTQLTKPDHEFVAAWYLALDQHVPAEGAATWSPTTWRWSSRRRCTARGLLAWYAGGISPTGKARRDQHLFDENHNVVSVVKISGDEAELTWSWHGKQAGSTACRQEQACRSTPRRSGRAQVEQSAWAGGHS
jgi:hypothetical protein